MTEKKNNITLKKVLSKTYFSIKNNDSEVKFMNEDIKKGYLLCLRDLHELIISKGEMN